MTTPFKVLDLTDRLGFPASRLLVGLGADVIRLQRADLDGVTDAEILHWHSGKRIISAEESSGVENELYDLLDGVDVVIESGDFDDILTMKWRADRPVAWAHVVHVVITPFGLTGPRRRWRGDDTVVTAAGGMAWLGGDPGAAPEPPPREQGAHVTGAHAAIGAMLALIVRRRTGAGQLVEISAQEAVAATLETGAIAWIHAKTIPARTSGVYGHVAHRVFATADGHVGGGYSGSPRMWEDLLAWMVEAGEAEDLAEDRWSDQDFRWQHRPHVDEVVSRFVARRTTVAFAEEARRRALPWAEVAAPARLISNPQLKHREFLVDIDAAGSILKDVGFPMPAVGLPRPVRLQAPDNVAAGARWRSSPSASQPPSARAEPSPRDGSGGALDGLRVLDLTWVLAGPYATKILAEHGADVVKIESIHRKDPTRFSPGMRLRPGAGHDEAGYFLNFNRNKRSVALNLRTEEGQRLLRQLIGEVDVVVENFSPGVLAKWGLAYEQMRELNPGVVLVSMAGVGQEGPWRHAVTFADTLAAMSGFTYETGRAGRPPQGFTFGLGDMVAGNAAVLGALDLLLAGRGGHVDLSQLEAMAANLGPALLESQVGHTVEPLVPMVLRTRGEDRWLAIGSAPPEDVRSALRAILVAQNARAPQSDAELHRLARAHSADELAEGLQDLDIPAYPVRDGSDLLERDEQLRSRRFYVDLEHPLAGIVTHEGLVVHLHDTPGSLRKPAPLLGEHTEEQLRALLGLSAADVNALRAEGVLE